MLAPLLALVALSCWTINYCSSSSHTSSFTSDDLTQLSELWDWITSKQTNDYVKHAFLSNSSSETSYDDNLCLGMTKTRQILRKPCHQNPHIVVEKSFMNASELIPALKCFPLKLYMALTEHNYRMAELLLKYALRFIDQLNLHYDRLLDAQDRQQIYLNFVNIFIKYDGAAQRSILLKLRNYYQSTSESCLSLAISRLLFTALREHSLEDVRMLLDLRANVNMYDESHGDTPLTMTCKQGSPDLVSALLKHDSSHINLGHPKGLVDTPLHCVMQRNCSTDMCQIIGLLFENGAVPSVIDRLSRTPLTSLVMRLNAEVKEGHRENLRMAVNLMLNNSKNDIQPRYISVPVFREILLQHPILSILVKDKTQRKVLDKTGLLSEFVIRTPAQLARALICTFQIHCPDSPLRWGDLSVFFRNVWIYIMASLESNGTMEQDRLSAARLTRFNSIPYETCKFIKWLVCMEDGQKFSLRPKLDTFSLMLPEILYFVEQAIFKDPTMADRSYRQLLTEYFEDYREYSCLSEFFIEYQSNIDLFTRYLIEVVFVDGPTKEYPTNHA